jgi:hypothetical protein
MANEQERVKLRQGVKVTIDNVEVTHLRAMSGAGINIPQVEVTNSGSKNQEYSTGRCNFDPLQITFANWDDNIAIIENALKYYQDPQNGKRSTITITELTRGGAEGAKLDLTECFCTKIRMPKGNNQDGVLTTDMEWSIHQVNESGGGVA